jgi:hypothetical protein
MMDFKSLLKSIDRLNENVKHVSTGNYSGRIHDPEDARDDYGHLIPNPNKQAKLKRGGQTKAAKDDEGQDIKHDASHLQSMLGGRPQSPVKGNRKHTPMADADRIEKRMEKQLKGLRDWMEHIEADKTLNEATTTQDAIQIKPASQTQTQVIQQGNKTIGTVNNPQLAAQIKQSIGKGEMSLNPNEQGMAEDGGENWIKGAIKHPGAFTKKAKAAHMGTQAFAKKHAHDSGRLGKQARLAQTLNKMHEGIELSHSDISMLIEGINFQDLIKNADQSVENMLAALQQDVEEFKGTGHCSDLLDSFLKVHFHHTKVNEVSSMTDESSIENHSERNALNIKPSKFVSVNPNPAPTSFKTDPIQAVTDRGINAASKGLDFFKGLGSKNTPVKTFESKDMKDIQLENWEKELNSLLVEGITVSSSKGQQGAPDSVSINATEADAEQLMTILRNSGMDAFGGNSPQPNQPAVGGNSMMSQNVEPQGNGSSPEASPEVAGDDTDILSLIKKMSGVGGSSAPVGTAVVDFEPENGEEEMGDFTGSGGMGDMMKKMTDIESGEGSEEDCDDCGHSPCDCDDHGSDNHKDQAGTEKSDDEEEVDEGYEETDEGAGVMHLKKEQAQKAGKDHFKMGNKEFTVKEANDGNLANNAKPYDKVTQGDVVAGRLGKDEEGVAESDTPAQPAVQVMNDFNEVVAEFDHVPKGFRDAFRSSEFDAGQWLADVMKNDPDFDITTIEKIVLAPGVSGYPDEYVIDVTEYLDALDEGAEDCMECGYAMESCECDHMEESYANSNDDTAFQDLQYMLQVLAGGANGPKRSQATGNIQKVTMETKLMKDSTNLLTDFKKLSGIK